MAEKKISQAGRKKTLWTLGLEAALEGNDVGQLVGIKLRKRGDVWMPCGAGEKEYVRGCTKDSAFIKTPYTTSVVVEDVSLKAKWKDKSSRTRNSWDVTCCQRKDRLRAGLFVDGLLLDRCQARGSGKFHLSNDVLSPALILGRMSIMDPGSRKPRQDVKQWHLRGKWKEKFMENVVQRVKRERNQLLWDIRLAAVPTANSDKNDIVGSAFEQIVADELLKVKQSEVLQGQDGQEVNNLQDEEDMLWEYDPPDPTAELGDDEYEALMIAMEQALYEDLRAEIVSREAAILEEYEAAHAFEDGALAAVVEQWQEHEEGALLCPICRKRRLQQSNRIIHCGCGSFRIDTQHDQVGLEYLERRLAEVLQEHIDSSCRSQATFSIQRRFGIAALYMQCADCDCFQLVL
ncbi:hypothetical protein R1flu_009466 [Riccia fluitans]|uniref:RPA-interacting protein n=1 Tax=Riccia fluitans TaxID=41844 RepID=A0ABD1Z262_9MARC